MDDKLVMSDVSEMLSTVLSKILMDVLPTLSFTPRNTYGPGRQHGFSEVNTQASGEELGRE